MRATGPTVHFPARLSVSLHERRCRTVPPQTGAWSSIHSSVTAAAHASYVLTVAVMVRSAGESDVDGICRVCTEGYRATYTGLLPPEVIERTIAEFYVPQRVASELAASPPGWLGYLVAVDRESVVGAAGGGMIGDDAGELFVIYVDPARKGEGIGTMLLVSVTEQLLTHGAKEMWASVQKGNAMGISSTSPEDS